MSEINNEKFNEILKEAKEISKNAFLKFVKSNYGIDEDIFEHLWNIPIEDVCNIEQLVTKPYGNISKDDLIDKMWEIYEKSVDKDSIGSYIDLSSSNVIDDEDLVNWNEVSLEKFNAVILYKGNIIKEHIKEDESKLSQEELEEKYLQLLVDTITHEIIHANAQYIVDTLGIDTEEKNTENEYKSFEEEMRQLKEEFDAKKLKPEEIQELLEEGIFSNSINGAEVIDDNFDYINLEKLGEIIGKTEDKWKKNNEVLVEATTRIILNYNEGDSLEDSLYKVLKKRNGETIYVGTDDIPVLCTYALFTNELNEWIIFGAYEDNRKNLLQEKMKKIFGNGCEIVSQKNINELLKDYLDKVELSENQKNMLELIGIKLRSKTINAKSVLQNALLNEKVSTENTENAREQEEIYNKIQNNKEERD